MIEFTEKQQEFLQNAHHRWNIKEGATRSGKTYLDYFVIPKRILKVRNLDGLVVLMGNTRGTLQRNIIEPLQQMYGSDLVSSIKTNNTAILFGQRCHCLGADKTDQVDRLRGSSIKYCYGDEVVTWNEEVFQMLKSRLDKPYSKFDGTCNPDTPTHWFYEFLLNEKGLDIYRQSYNIDDNKYLDPVFVDNLKKEYAGSIYYDRYILGKWVRAEGLIYDTFNDDKIVDISNMRFGRKWVAVDYGTQNATCFLMFGGKNQDVYVMKEYYYSGRDTNKQKTDSDYCNDMLDFIKGHGIENIVVDPSASSFIEILRRTGLSVKKARNDVLDGIRRVSSQFCLNRLFVDSSCQNLISELKTYSWDDHASDERPVKENDHAVDALRYGVMYNKASSGILTI